MTTLNELEARGLVQTGTVHAVWVKDGQIVGAEFNGGWQGEREESGAAVLYPHTEVRLVRLHYGACKIADEDMPRVLADAIRELRSHMAYEAGYAANCGVTQGLSRMLNAMRKAGQPDLTDEELNAAGWERIPLTDKRAAIAAVTP